MRWTSSGRWNVFLLLVFITGSLFIEATRMPAPLNASSGQPRVPTPVVTQARHPAPDFTLPGVNGDMLALEDFKGQVVLINIWATWCPPCRAEMPTIEAVYQRYRDQGFTVLAVNQGEEAEAVAAFMREFQLSFPALLDQDGAVSREYRASNLPSSFFVDRQGMLRAVYLGPMSRGVLTGTVEQLLGEES